MIALCFKNTPKLQRLENASYLMSLEEKCAADHAGKLVVTRGWVFSDEVSSEGTEDSRRLRDIEAEAELRLRLGRVEFIPNTGGELPRVKLGREGEPAKIYVEMRKLRSKVNI